MRSPQCVKVLLMTSSGADAIIETPWAVLVGLARFRIEDTPFDAWGVSWDYIIEATPRVPKKLLDDLVALGCGFTGATPRYICINIPSSVDLESVVRVLVDSRLRWEHADPTYEQLYPGCASGMLLGKRIQPARTPIGVGRRREQPRGSCCG